MRSDEVQNDGRRRSRSRSSCSSASESDGEEIFSEVRSQLIELPPLEMILHGMSEKSVGKVLTGVGVPLAQVALAQTALRSNGPMPKFFPEPRARSTITAQQLVITLSNMAQAWEAIPMETRLPQDMRQSFFGEQCLQSCGEILYRWHQGESTHPNREQLKASYPCDENGRKCLFTDVNFLRSDASVQAADIQLQVASFTGLPMAVPQGSAAEVARAKRVSGIANLGEIPECTEDQVGGRSQSINSMDDVSGRVSDVPLRQTYGGSSSVKPNFNIHRLASASKWGKSSTPRGGNGSRSNSRGKKCEEDDGKKCEEDEEIFERSTWGGWDSKTIVTPPGSADANGKRFNMRRMCNQGRGRINRHRSPHVKGSTPRSRCTSKDKFASEPGGLSYADLELEEIQQGVAA